MLKGRNIPAECPSGQPDQALNIHAGLDMPVSRLRVFAHAAKHEDITFSGTLCKLPFFPVEHPNIIIPPDAGEVRVR
jgi:hypothetical protein